MPKYVVVLTEKTRQFYQVHAESEQEAKDKAVNLTPNHDPKAGVIYLGEESDGLIGDVEVSLLDQKT